MRKRVAIAFATLGVLASGGAGVAAASAPVTPVNGLSGACNMANTNAAFGMFTIAGSHANANGFEDGMNTAIFRSNGGTFPENCG